MKYIIDDYNMIDKTAGSKARKDIVNILNSYKTVYLAHSEKKIIDLLVSTFNVVKTSLILRAEDTLIVQWPLGLRWKLKECKFIKWFNGRKIVLIHDINSVRFNPQNKELIAEEIKRLNLFDVIIAHNNSMRNWLLENGITKPVHCLNLFDYVAMGKVTEKMCKEKEKYQISVAGNLDPQKSGYIYKLANSSSYELLVYGVNFQENEKITYKGSFASDELPNIIEGDFGLVWDGTSLDCCEGNIGNYLRYNNPHKLSLYVCASMPVIVWAESAVAKFVLENNIGFCVNSLEEIDDILSQLTKEKYEEYYENVWQLSKKVREGYYTKKVLSEIGLDV